MKYLFFLTFTASLILQGFAIAQSESNRPAHALGVQVQSTFSSHENYDHRNNFPSQNSETDDEDDEENDDDTDKENHGASNSHNEQKNSQTPSISNYIDKVRSNQPTEAIERTLSIIKPDAVRNRHIGDVISRFEDAGLHVIAIKMTKLNAEQARQFYKIHRDRPFFRDLVDFMSSGPIVIMVLEGKNAVNKNRQLMGATDPLKADKGTIRADLADSVTRNAVHGSDSPTTAREEILFFFKPQDLYSTH